ncbi:UNVERIFIED_CONTAM: hypothetical protein RMT77_009002 [Armadillidium vulgare]
MATAPTVPRIEGYALAEKLGSGSYADVYKGYKKGGKEVVAVKCVVKNKLSKAALNNLISEIEILKSLCHANIVKLKDFCWDDTHVFIIMEYCGGGNLLNYIHQRHRLSEKICQRFLQQLVLALLYLREKNISHFDLKPQNILIASRKLQILKIADFGLAQYITDDDKNSVLKGSPLYMAPEIVLKREYDARADIWSVGIILYECLFGKAPYSSKSFEELISKIKANKPIEIPSNANISNECRDFLKGCLQRELSKRFDFNSFFDHPFVDLAHAPSSESINKATEHLTKAIEDDKLGNCKEALHSYDEALKYLIPMMHFEVDSVKRMSLRKKINEYINRMETIKSQVSGESSNIRPLSAVMYKPEKLIYDGCLPELLQLTKTTPQMTTAIEIAQSAELYEKEQNYSAALEKYEMALGKLLNLLQNEPKGRRRDLLIEEVSRWMDQAERIKALTRGSSLPHSLSTDTYQIGDAERNCSIQ